LERLEVKNLSQMKLACEQASGELPDGKMKGRVQECPLEFLAILKVLKNS